LDVQLLRQGDVLTGGRLFFQREEFLSVVKEESDLRVVPSRDLPDAEQVSLLPTVESDLAVITQSCDVVKPDIESVLLAPVFPLETGGTVPCAEALPETRRNEIRRHRITWAFHLPEIAGAEGKNYPDSFVDLRIACTLTKEVLSSLDLARKLRDSEREDFRRFLFNLFGRPAIPDDVVAAIKPVANTARDSTIHKHLHSVWIDITGLTLRLLVVLHQPDDKVHRKLQKAGEKAAAMTTGYEVKLDIKIKDSTRLCDVEGLTRFGWDNLSFGQPDDAGSTDLEL